MPNKRRRLVGRVVSDKMDKTVVVSVERTGSHPLYGKVVRTTKKYFAHDESNAIPVGSTVQIVESQPISKKKRWMVEEVIVAMSQAAAEAAASEAEAPEAHELAAELLADAELPSDAEEAAPEAVAEAVTEVEAETPAADEPSDTDKVEE